MVRVFSRGVRCVEAAPCEATNHAESSRPETLNRIGSSRHEGRTTDGIAWSKMCLAPEGKRCVVTQHAWQGRRFARPLHPTRAGGFRTPMHPRRGAFLPRDPDHIHGGQPCAGWMRGNGLSRCIDNRERLAPPIPPASGFRARHHDARRSASRHLTKLAPLG